MVVALWVLWLTEYDRRKDLERGEHRSEDLLEMCLREREVSRQALIDLNAGIERVISVPDRFDGTE